MFQEVLNSIHHFVMKIQTKGNFLKLRLTIHQILTFKVLSIFIERVQQSRIFFWLLILLLHQKILYFLERIL